MKFLIGLVKDRYSALDLLPIMATVKWWSAGDYLHGLLLFIGGMVIVTIVTVLVRILAKGGEA